MFLSLSPLLPTTFAKKRVVLVDSTKHQEQCLIGNWLEQIALPAATIFLLSIERRWSVAPGRYIERFISNLMWGWRMRQQYLSILDEESSTCI